MDPGPPSILTFDSKYCRIGTWPTGSQCSCRTSHSLPVSVLVVGPRRLRRGLPGAARLRLPLGQLLGLICAINNCRNPKCRSSNRFNSKVLRRCTLTDLRTTECVNSSVSRFARKFLCKFLLQFSSCLTAQQASTWELLTKPSDRAVNALCTVLPGYCDCWGMEKVTQ